MDQKDPFFKNGNKSWIALAKYFVKNINASKKYLSKLFHKTSFSMLLIIM
jgi:hypothetical protein